MIPIPKHRLMRNVPNGGAVLPALLAAVLCALAGCPPNGADPAGETSQDILEKEEAAFDAVNEERGAEGLEALIMREDLRLVARAHSEDMVARDFFSHENPDEQSPFDRAAEAGLSYRIYGENIAMTTFPNPVPRVVTGWMESPGHRANILLETYTHTGMGVAHDGAGGYYFTQVFMTPREKESAS